MADTVPFPKHNPLPDLECLNDGTALEEDGRQLIQDGLIITLGKNSAKLWNLHREKENSMKSLLDEAAYEPGAKAALRRDSAATDEVFYHWADFDGLVARDASSTLTVTMDRHKWVDLSYETQTVVDLFSNEKGYKDQAQTSLPVDESMGADGARGCLI